MSSFLGGGGGGTGGSGTVTQVNTGAGLTGGPINTVGTVAIANTPVVPGSYTNTNLTVNAQGQITAAASGMTGGTVATFPTVAAAESGIIPDSANYLTVLGNKVPGDGGLSDYQRVSSLPSAYVGDGSVIPLVPPNFTSGGVPILCFAKTTFDAGGLGITHPILAGTLAILAIFDSELSSPVSSYTDSVGNIYLLAVNSNSLAGVSEATIYYCANPVFAPIGTTFVGIPSPSAYNAFTIPGFPGAVLDQTGTLSLGSTLNTGATVSTGALTATPEFCFAMIYAGGSPIFGTNGPAYSVPAGWGDLSAPILGRNPMGYTAVSNTAPVSFSPTWPSHTSILVGCIATFKTFPKTAFDVSYWQLLPSSPLHTAACGIDPATPDNLAPFRSFSRYLATTAAPSGEITAARAGLFATGTVTISISSPAIITVTTAGVASHGLHNGQMISFSTTGQLPTGIVAGQIYYVQYGTVTQTGFQISATSIFNPSGSTGGQYTVAKGVPIATSGTQSGTHSYTVYGQSWTDFVLDPGIYYASQNQVPGIGAGLQKFRLLGYGARLATNGYFTAIPWYDVNAATSGTTYAFSTQFQTTNPHLTGAGFANSIVLNTPAQASNFYINSWVVLMCCEMMASANGNWNAAIFEFAQIQSIDVPSGTITFYSTLQYNYRSTYPIFFTASGGFPGQLTGPATIVQLSDVFDQYMEIHGLNMFAPTEETTGGCLSVRFVDCDIWGCGFDTGPAQFLVGSYSMENCRFHNYIPEVDKMIDFMLFEDCYFDGNSQLRFQSASINKCVINRCKMLGGMAGTPRDMTIRDSYMTSSFTVGPVIGSTERMTLINSHIQRLLMNDQDTETLSLSVVGLTFVNGTIKIAVGTVTNIGSHWNGPGARSDNPAFWAQPGAKIALDVTPGTGNSGTTNIQGTLGMMTCFTVLDVYTDGSGAFCIDTDLTAFPNTAITATATVSGTTMAVTAISPAGAAILRGATITGGGLPAGTTVTTDLGLPNASNNLGNYTISNSATIGSPTAFTITLPMNFSPHPCARLTVINCTGDRFVADQYGAPPDIPMYSYFKRAFAGGPLSVFSGEKNIYLAGNLLSWTINVLKPYTGAQSSYPCVLSIVGFAISGGITYPTYITQSIDLKTVGLRTITAAGVSGSVGADSIAAIPFWITGQHAIVTGPANVSDTLVNYPFFIMAAQTDQGVGFGGMVVNTVTAGVDQFADTVTGASTT